MHSTMFILNDGDVKDENRALRKKGESLIALRK